MRYTVSMLASFRHLRKYAAIGLFVGSIALAATAHAQTQPTLNLLLTWQARTLVAPLYPGKALPTNGSIIDLRLLATGKENIVDLTNTTVEWLVNGRRVGSGKGLVSLALPLNEFNAKRYAITARVRDLAGELHTAGTVINTIEPKVVVARSTVVGNTSSTLMSAFGYFFNTQNQSALRFVWSANSTTQVGQTILLQKEADAPLSVRVTASLIETGQSAQKQLFMQN